MGSFLVARICPSRSRRGVRLRGLGVFVVFWSALIPSLAPAENAVPVRQSAASSGVRVPSVSAHAIVAADVVLRAGGVMHGVVVTGSSVSTAEKAVAGVRLVLLRGGKVVAEAKSDEAGRFSVSGLSGGQYVIAIRHHGNVCWHLCRVWSPGTAPPKASGVSRFVLGEGIVRGQGPLPTVSFSEAALMAGVVAGAVAAPIIYHNAQKSNRVPASP
jgi:hypothetical protein